MNGPVARIPLPLLPLLVLLPACGGAGSGGDTGPPASACAGDTGAPAPDWETWAEPFFTTWCQPCHATDAPQRYGAPEHATFDTEAQTRDQAAGIRATVLEGRSMPVGGGLSLEDEAQLSAWLCTVEASP